MLPAGMHMLPFMQTLPAPQHWMPQRFSPKPQQTMSSMQRSLEAQTLRPHRTLPLAAMKTPAVQEEAAAAAAAAGTTNLSITCSIAAVVSCCCM
jgi:hypothetical protein